MLQNEEQWKRLPQTKPLLPMKLHIAVKTTFEKLTPIFEELCDAKGGQWGFCSLLYVTIFSWVIFYQMWSFRWGQSDTKIFESVGISLDHGTVKHQVQNCFLPVGEQKVWRSSLAICNNKCKEVNIYIEKNNHVSKKIAGRNKRCWLLCQRK